MPAEVMRATVATAIAIATGLACAVPAQAQSDALLLARTCVSERGFDIDTDDCAAIADVVRSRMERTGSSFAASIRALAPRLHASPCRVSRRWLCELDESATRPAHLGAARWEGARRDAWLATLAEARAILAGERASVCAGVVSWGSRADVRAREALGRRRFVAADCGVTRNVFGRWVTR